MLTMIIDHIGAILIEPLSLTSFLGFNHWETVYLVCRLIGRLAFPIFAFLIVEGYSHTHNFNKYLLRLISLALLSEIPFDLAFNQSWFDMSYQNIFFTLSLGLIAIWSSDRWDNQFLGTLFPLGIIFMAEWLQVDYGAYGVFFIYILYVLRDKRLYQCIAGAVLGFLQLTASLSFILIYFYNGQKGRANFRWMYVIYPVHLVILIFIRHGLFAYIY
ncbi:TraX family protein [Fundicoccus culcitae]|uniref:Conjugal transfer protein TraX n=1 Tax=Fundicoccus culcitae TaxID=2969821 RepID=A0ABY5P6I8_9LACT|nr:TraX family protein [Fundicoccus culcitae]UUX34294.1 conjugal transfer protein TraX [Fundicoccus culcitae]